MAKSVACLSPQMLARLCALAAGKSAIYITPDLDDGHSGPGVYVWFDDFTCDVGSYHLGNLDEEKNGTKTESVDRTVVPPHLRQVK